MSSEFEIQDVALEEIAGFHPAILLVTATTIETISLLRKLRPISGAKGIYRVTKGCRSYFLGILGEFMVVHVKCDMGGNGARGSALTVAEALEHWGASAVIMPGIAFGVDDEKQVIGDLLVSQGVIPYDSKKVRKGSEVPTGKRLEAGKILVDRFTSNIEWNFRLPDRVAKIIPTELLSGETLFDDLEARNALIKQFPGSHGGEMEGVGISSASSLKNVEWIIVKGICDFADGDKGRNKKERQALAVNSAISLLEKVLSVKHNFEELGIYCYKGEAATSVTSSRDQFIGSVLFDRYSRENSAYYILRNHDSRLSETLEHYHLWLWGKSGSGKTNSVLRYLDTIGVEASYVSLGPYIGASGVDLFRHFVGELADVTTGCWPIKIKDMESHELVKEMSKFLLNRSSIESALIYVDEIPVETTSAVSSSAMLPLPARHALDE